MHKICIEGTSDLFQYKNQVRVQFSFENDVKKEEQLEGTLKTEDFHGAETTVRQLESLVSEISSQLRYGEEKETTFTDNQSGFNSKLVWFNII